MRRGAGRSGVGRLLVALLVATGVLPAAQPAAQVAQTTPLTVCRLPVAPLADATALVPPPAGRPARPACAAPTARFEVSYTGFAPDAQRAFQAAVDTWACLVASPVPIRVDARWEPLAASTLGSAGPYLVRNFERAPVNDTWYPAALADALAGYDLDARQADVDAAFNSQFAGWHTDPGLPPAAGAFDLYTVVLHELGHGLGLIGGLTVRDGLGYVGRPDATRGPYIYDRFAEDADGTPLLDARAYPDASALLAEALTSEVWFDGAAVRQASDRARLYTPDPWVDGASYSHLDETRYAADTPDGLMTPFLRRGEAIAAPGAVTCALLADLGWTLAGDCATLVGPLDRPAAGLDAVRTGPNPFTDATTVRVRVALRQHVRAVLLDAIGRTVAIYADRDQEPGTDLQVRVDGRRLAGGVYRLVVWGDGDAVVLPLVMVR